jgi:hypothetical protein
MIRGVIGPISLAFSAAGYGNRPAIILIGHGDVGSGIDCRSLLLVDVSFHGANGENMRLFRRRSFAAHCGTAGG